MKRRVLSLGITLALCLNLCPVWVLAADGLSGDSQQQEALPSSVSSPDQMDGMGAAVQSNAANDISTADQTYTLQKDESFDSTCEISKPLILDTNGHTLTGNGSNMSTLRVTGTGDLDLRGKVVSYGGSAVEVLSGGTLRITEGGTSISGSTYGLDISSGAHIYLSAGTYFGMKAAIRADDFASLLAPGCGYFDTKSGNPILPTSVATVKELSVRQCTNHAKTYAHTSGATTHTWTCAYCAATGTEPCTFDFVQNGDGTSTCADCGNSLAIDVNQDDLSDLVYDGTVKPQDVRVTVTLTDGSNKELVKDTDYEVDIQPITNAGQATVTVTGITFNGTFVKTYTVKQDEPGIRWDGAACATNYDGSAVTAGELPHITITIKASEDLHPLLKYQYRKDGDAGFTDGLPTNAGTYQVKAYLEASQNYTAAETDPLLTLTIKPIAPIVTAPTATKPIYNRSPQALVTAGTLNPVAIAEGLNIQFATEENGTYSDTIPSGTDAGDYTVWYQVTGLTDNYNAPNSNPAQVPGVNIQRKAITPVVTLSEYTYLYDGGYKQPAVTVKDDDHVTVLLDTEYQVAYQNNRDVGTAKVVVTDRDVNGGNYDLTQVEVEFVITSKTQDTLSITQKPNTITYGDQFTLGTTGGSDSGSVTWEITAGTDVAEVGRNSGQVTIIGDGMATVKATKSGGNNYEDAVDTWEFTAVKKPVTATVTAEDKDYDGNTTAAVHAVVESGVLAGDEIIITDQSGGDLTGTFGDAKAGVDKMVTVDFSNAKISGHNSQHYAVSYSSTTVKATIHRAVAQITTAPGAATLTYNGNEQTLISTAAAVDPNTVQVEYALHEDGPYSTDFPKGTNAGAYTVWYRVQETDNYTGLAPANVAVTINKKPVSPTITLDQDSFVFDGTAKEPAVTLTEPDGTIPTNEYTVEYSNNINVSTVDTPAAVTVTAKADGNYTFENAPVTATFTINEKQAKVLTAPEPAGRPLFFANYDQQLVTAGTAEGGTMVYRVGDTGNFEPGIPERTAAGTYKVYYKVQGDANHSDSDVASVEVTIAPKGVNPTIELKNADDSALVSYTYDGSAKKPKVVVKDGSDIIGEGEYTIVYSNNKDAGTATVSITDNPGGNYTVTGSTTFEILRADIVFNPAPSAAALTYNGKAQPLLVPGTTSGGTVYYALGTSTSEYHDYIPTGVNAGAYKVYYKVTGDKNHNDLPITEVPVTIQRKPLTAPTIELTPNSFAYDGAEHLPTVAVKDGDTVLPASEYTWACNVSAPEDSGTYTITISDVTGGNYDLGSATLNTATFTIGKSAQAELVIEGKPDQVYYGDSFKLTTSGGSGGGSVSWTVVSGPATVDTSGNVTITGVGGVTITAEKAADTNYDAAQAQWTFTAAPKPVTAAVTVSSKPYDGTTTATVASAGITTINSDPVTIDPASITAAFEDPHAGTNKTVTLDASNVQVTGDTAKYAISYPAAVTADITQATTTIDTAPAAIAPLTYSGQPQALVTAGQTNVGFLEYSLNGTDFSPEIPTGTDAGTYTVSYKVDGTADYTGVAMNAAPISVTIGPKAITPKIELSETSYRYDGTKKTPKVTLKDGGTVIPEGQYTVTWAGTKGQTDADMLRVADTYTATIKHVDSGNNYTFNVTADVEIIQAEQAALKITGKPAQVYYGDTITLDTIGGSGDGTVTWSITDGGAIAAIGSDTGVLTIKDVGNVTVKAERTVSNYGTVSDTWSFTVKPKPITAIVTAEDKVYDGDTRATIHVTWEDGALVGTDLIKTDVLSGEFADENAGPNKTVHIMGGPISNGKYAVTIPAATTASILKANVTVPSLTAQGRVYDSTTEPLVFGGDGNTWYSDAQNGVYSTTVPTGTNAGTYTVWYKEKGDDNHNDSEPQSIQVTITRKPLTADDTNTTLSGNDLMTDTTSTPNVYYYEYDGTERKPAVTIKDVTTTIPASEYKVSYSDNKNVSTAGKKATVTITDSGNGNYNVSGRVNFEIRQCGAQLITYPQARVLTYTGQMQELVIGGTVTGGHIEYSLDGVAYGTDIPKAKDAGAYTVAYKVVGDGNHLDGDAGSVSVTIRPQEVISPEVTVSGSYTYDSNPQIPADGAVTVKDRGTTIPDTEYTLSYRDNVNAGTATVIVTNANGGNYIVNGTGTFEIAKGSASVAEAPQGLENLPYNGTEQALATEGTATGGTMVYSLDRDGEYSPAIPTGKAVSNSYTVWYKVQGDSNHTDTGPQSVTATIIVNNVTNPTIQVTPESVTFNGKKQEPTVTVKDDSGLLIDGGEYEVTYAASGGNDDLIQVGTYTVTITNRPGSSYVISDSSKQFEILLAGQTPLTITGTRERVCYGDTIQLGTTGGNGTVTWTVSDGSPAEITGGLLTVKGVGSVTVTATSTKPGYTDQTAVWSFYAEKKQITAVVTAEDRVYTGGDQTATLHVTWKAGDVVGSDDTDIDTTALTGEFTDANVGTNKTVKITGTLTHANYHITVPPTATASIFKADVDETKVTPPTAVTDLEYTGLPQALVTAGSSPDGVMEYSLDNLTYSTSLPTGTGAGDYQVWYRVKGDGNHNDTVGTPLAGQVTIDRQTVVAPIIEFTPNDASYDGAVHKPSVTVKDGNGRVIPDSEYTVDYGSTDWIKVGNHTVTITGKTGGNYDITGTPTGVFTIHPAGQAPLSIVNQPGGRIQYGSNFTLSTTGGSGTGTVAWASNNSAVASIDQNGLVEVCAAGGPVTITATRTVDGYNTATASWTFSAEKKPVTAVVTAKDKVYDATNEAELVVTWKDGDLLNGDTIDLDTALTGTFDNANVGTNKRVTITGTAPDNSNYIISYNQTTTASITPAAARVTPPTPLPVGYSGQPQDLVNAGAAVNGTITYSLDGIVYGPNIPQGTNAGSYTVWYKVTGFENYKDIAPAVVPVTVSPKPVASPVIELSPNSFEYDGTPKKPDVVVKDNSTVIPASEYTVSYSNNVNVGQATVTITDNAGGNYTVSGSTTFTIKAGTASLISEPQPRELIYTGAAQTLVTAGTAVNGRVVYSLDPGNTYTTSIPRGTNAGNYEVWYKVQGENGASDTQPQFVEVTIQPKEVTPTILLNGQYAFSTSYTGQPITPTVTVNVGGEAVSSFTPTYSNNTKVGTATVTVQSTGGNYKFFGVATFEITKAKATFSSKPTAKPLEYTGESQELVIPGVSAQSGLLVVYSTDGYSYLPAIPTATDRGDYVVIAKVQGNETYEDSDLVVIPVEITRNTVVSPTVNLSANSMNYTGSELRPAVTVIDKGVTIPSSEYTVSYSNNVNVGEATVTVTGNTNNYTYFTATAKFQIVDASQPVLTITGKPSRVCYGDTVATLKAEGASGAVTWSVTGGSSSTIDQTTGRLVVKDAGTITVTATSGSLSDTWTFAVEPKPVTAVVTAESKPYDGSATAKLTVTLSSGLVSGDVVNTVTATGHFADASVGENKTVVIDGLTIPAEVSAKYDISWPAITTASITPRVAAVTNTPTAAAGLAYNGSPQPLLASGGTADGGTLAYSLDGGSYSYNLPTAVDAGSYTVWYKVVAGDGNHKDSAPAKVGPVTISANTGAPTVLCTPDQFRYDGTAKTPAVVVRDSANRIIPEGEYTVELPAPRIAAGTYTVTVMDNLGGNYEFTTPATGTFKIVAASQDPLSIITDKPTDVSYGETFRLSAMGGSGGGAVKWSIKETNGVASVDDNGVVTVKGTGGFTVEAYREASDSYDQSNTASVPFVAKPKSVTPVVKAVDKPYDGNKTATLEASWRSGDLVNGDTITFTELAGEFVTADVGTGKQVTIVKLITAGANLDKYTINWPDGITASISRVDAKMQTMPTAVTGLTYNGNPQALVTSGSTVGNIGTIEYSLNQNSGYSTTIPTGTNAGSYTVWYRVQDSVNYMGFTAGPVEAKIEKATPNVSYPTASPITAGQLLKDSSLTGGGDSVNGSFAWKDGGIKPLVGTSQQDVVFTPYDTTNYNTVELKVWVTVTAASGNSISNDSGSTNSPPSADTSGTPLQATVQDGTATAVLSASEGSRLVREAAANQSQSVVIRPEVTGDVTKTQVSIPASMVSQLSQTNAALTVSAPIADVTIPNGALDTLGSADGAINVVTEQVGKSVVLTLTAGGETVESVPGGVNLTVPAENAGPGTVAVLVHEDGTREVIRKSIAGDGKVSVPLDGSATVEIVDNSKDYADVPAESWAADAVAFASAHELFSGTSETTFSPDQSMSRGMLATVLYSLEGRPDQALTSEFNDVDSDTWYAESIAWATENGITSGYGDGQFGPDDSVTREQLAVMLWKYAGSPKASSESLGFTDADQVSGYAVEALCWATENGILSGYTGGQLDPGGTATRAQAAQMLKNFLENT